MPELSELPPGGPSWKKWLTLGVVCLATGALAFWWWGRAGDGEMVGLSDEVLEPPPPPVRATATPALPKDRPLTLADFGIDVPPPTAPGATPPAATPPGSTAPDGATPVRQTPAPDATGPTPVTPTPPPPAPAGVEAAEVKIEEETVEFTVLVGPREALARAVLDGNRSVLVRSGRAVFPQVKPGEHELVIEAPGYDRFTERVSIGVGRLRHAVALLPQRAELVLTAQPGSVVSVVDPTGRESKLGFVPDAGELREREHLRAGVHQVKVEHPRYETWLARLDLPAGRPYQVTAEQRRLTGVLRVESMPAGANVLINGQARGVTPLIARDVPAGEALKVELTLDGYRAETREVTLETSKVRLVDFGALGRRDGSVRVRLPPEALPLTAEEVEFRLDGEVVHPAPIATSGAGATAWEFPGVAPGRHVVEVRPTRFNAWADLVEVKADAVSEAEARLVEPTPQVIAVPAAFVPRTGEAWTVPELGLELVWIAPGTATLGDEVNNADRRLLPRRVVELTHGFWLGRYEVTQAEWMALMERNPSERQESLQHPVENVSWNEAMDFCRRLTERERAAGRLPPNLEYTLPTEAQWEYACRAGDAPVEGELTERAWHRENSGNRTHAVGELRPNPWGLHDMLGNVWEWVRDAYTENGAGTAAGGDGGFRVNRGGGYSFAARAASPASRYGNSARFRGRSLGFRVALVHVGN